VIHWATLDDRWFANYGDWEPRPDTFPDDSIRRMVDSFHREGLRVQLWWLILGVEPGEGGYGPHRYSASKVVREHPDWLILDSNGHQTRMARHLAILCPALPEVQEYYRKLTTRFIRDWGFDGHKLDVAFGVPPCFNPAHHHQSPDDSIRAVGKVFDVIFRTTRSLKPQSVTQICPCGTPPSLAWFTDMDQAVTADPVGAVQVRRRIKMYKALLGPRAAVYGDHVELSEMKQSGRSWLEVGQDFASTLGTGGVPGTKFTFPDYGPKFKQVFLTPAKEAHWKKWTSLYNSMMLSQGEFLNLYTIGYDVPEGYAIRKGQAFYYAFFPAQQGGAWTGQVELRGLSPNVRYQLRDYENDRSLGETTGPVGRLDVDFKDHLLVEAKP
jgi:alpha-galactosidase